tara:strand:- start:480 stop:1670 length:1191 start_codon:yes stop_codon:yes gene_type:complete
MVQITISVKIFMVILMHGKFETKIIHEGEYQNKHGDATMPIHLSSTFIKPNLDTSQEFEYSRAGNPSRSLVEKKLAILENAKFALAFSSGLAAETVALLTLLKPGDHMIAFDDLYGGTKRLFDKIFKEKFKIHVDYVDLTKIDNLKSAIQENTKLIWIETPTNPLLKVCDINKISKLKKNSLVLVDNTFLSPYFQNPLELGADIVLHSTTKYINGHSDSIGGAIMVNDSSLYDSLKFNQNATGAILSPFDSFLVARGIKTLAIRMEKHQENALKIAHFLETHQKIKKVIYPGLKSHPQFEIVKKQFKGYAGIISFEILGTKEKLNLFLNNLKIFKLAESLGGVESLINVPSLMTHAYLSEKERNDIGINDNLMRLSIGIENVEDLIQDLDIALKSV